MEAVEARRRWGCDQEAPVPLGFVRCGACSGRLPDCGRCASSPRKGYEAVTRCPNAEALPAVAPALPYVWIAARNHVYPVAGGLLAQAAAFLDAAAIVEEELALVEREQLDRARQG